VLSIVCDSEKTRENNNVTVLLVQHTFLFQSTYSTPPHVSIPIHLQHTFLFQSTYSTRFYPIHQHACSGGEAPTPPPPPAAVFDLGCGLERVPGRLVSKGHEQLAMEAQCFLASLPEASASTDAARQAMGVGMTLCNRLKEAGATAEEALLRQAVVGVIQGGAGR
jgi:hypothetical protein